MPDFHDRTDRKDNADRIEPTPTAEAIEPTDRIEPAEMLSSESCEPIDHREPWLSLMPGILAPGAVPATLRHALATKARGGHQQ